MSNIIDVNGFCYEIEEVVWYQSQKCLVFKVDDEDIVIQIHKVNTLPEAKVYAEGFDITVK